MAVEFKIIRNPNRLLFKHEVWIKGTAVYPDALGQVRESMEYNRKAASFVSESRAQGFVDYNEAQQRL